MHTALRDLLLPWSTIAIVEVGVFQIFGIDGVGRLASESALDNDDPAVIGIALFAAVVFTVGNFAVDVLTQLRCPARHVAYLA